MHNVHCEVGRDPETHQLWGLEVFDDKIIGCVGPFSHEAAIPARLGAERFERNGELLRWLRQRLSVERP